MTTRRGQHTRFGWDWWRADAGQVTAFVVALLVGILALAGLGLDGGLALAAKVRATGQAESAARAGAQALDLAAYRATGTVGLLPGQADRLARDYLASVGASGNVQLAGDTVTVTVTIIYRPQLLSLIGIEAIHAHGSGSAHPQRGIQAVSLGFANSEVDSDGNSSGGGR